MTKLYLIGTGPGDQDLVTPKAQAAPSVNAALQSKAATAENIAAAAAAVQNDLGDDVMGEDLGVGFGDGGDGTEQPM